MPTNALSRPIGRPVEWIRKKPSRHGKTGASSLRPLLSLALAGGANDNGDVNAEKGPRLTVAWADMVAALAAQGWARAPQALDDALAKRLAEDDGWQWHTAGDEGVVRQHVIGSYRPFAEAPPPSVPSVTRSWAACRPRRDGKVWSRYRRSTKPPGAGTRWHRPYHRPP